MHFQSLRRCLAVIATAAVLAPAAAEAAVVSAIEFYNAALDHYFVTASADEIGKLDNGFFVGWQRTGQSFKVYDPSTNGTGANPVCRFYGLPSAGLDSHFYSASPDECAAVAQKFAGVWELESNDVFKVFLPNTTTGACPSGSIAIYRSWNGRADSNHRYTTDLATQNAMIAKGYVAEGYGPTPVAMCSPQTAGGAVPACQIIVDNANPQVGSQATLTASCTNSPTSFAWTNCASVTSSCTASAAAPGPQTYTVVATNAAGPSVPANVTLNWAAPPPPDPPPVCVLSATAASETPTVGSLAVMLATCSGSPTSYSWTGGNCASQLTNLCKVRAGSPGVINYSVTAFNSSGSGNASIPVSWVATAAPPSGQCGSFPSALYSNVGSSGQSVYSTYFTDPGGFVYNSAWAVKFTVPATAAAGAFGSLLVAEFNGPPTFREISVSRSACDFRATDLSGASGPLGRATGNSATLPFKIGANTVAVTGLAAGQTYYLNVRNYSPGSGTVTCTSSQARCDAIATVNLPQ
jgi:hypothetical protein